MTTLVLNQLMDQYKRPLGWTSSVSAEVARRMELTVLSSFNHSGMFSLRRFLAKKNQSDDFIWNTIYWEITIKLGSCLPCFRPPWIYEGMRELMERSPQFNDNFIRWVVSDHKFGQWKHEGLSAQVANLGPLSYAFLKWVTKGRVNEKLCIYILLTVGTASGFLLSQYWSQTVLMLGSQRSLALFILVFCLSMVDCTSSILFMPFMAVFR